MTKALAFLFVAGLVAVANVPSMTNAAALTDSSHNLVVGSREAGDYLLNKQQIDVDPVRFQIVKAFVIYRGGSVTITQVKAFDEDTDGNGGYVSLAGGGPGSSDVSLGFESQRGYGMKYTIEIYGYQ